MRPVEKFARATGEVLKVFPPESAPLLLADCYQSGQHYVEADGVLQSYPEAAAWVKYEAEVTVLALLAMWVR